MTNYINTRPIDHIMNTNIRETHEFDLISLFILLLHEQYNMMVGISLIMSTTIVIIIITVCSVFHKRLLNEKKLTYLYGYNTYIYYILIFLSFQGFV